MTAMEQETRTEQCVRHGSYQSKRRYVGSRPLNVWSNCPQCESEREQERARVTARENDESARRRREARLTASGVYARHQHCTFQNFDCTSDRMLKCLEACKDIADKIKAKEQAPSLVLCGTVGTGKTHLGCATVIECIKSGASAKITTMFELVRELKSSWDKENDWTESDVISSYSLLDLLVIDEMGVQNGSDTEKNLLSEIVDNRYRACKPTIIAGNLTLDDMQELVGKRVLSRLKEGGGQMLVMNWEDYRGKI